jgi:hypothetical protein
LICLFFDGFALLALSTIAFKGRLKTFRSD